VAAGCCRRGNVFSTFRTFGQRHTVETFLSSLSPRSNLQQDVSILASLVNLQFLYCSCVPVPKLLDAISSQVARLLKEERKKRGLSLNVLSQRAGLSRQTVSYVEQEVQNPTLDTLLRITSVLEVDLEKIIAQARKRASAEMQ
jgi:DNA-binding XRE family transcriptional regulator